MKKILHFHIPKTGGIAIQHHLIEQLGKERVSDSIIGSRLRDALVQYDYLDVISGHFVLQQGDRLPQDRCSLTVLRHPFDRFLSEFFYHKVDCADRPLDTRLQGLDLDAYLEQLSCDEREALALQIGMLYPLGTSSRSALSLDDKFTAAAKAIESFDMIGVQEELEDFSCMLDAKFGWEYVPLKLKNATSQRIKVELLSPAQVKKLNALFSHEMELYLLAKSRFQASRREFLKCSITVDAHQDGEIGNSVAADVSDPVDEDPSLEFGDRSCVIDDVSVMGEISGGSLVMVGEYFDVSIKVKSQAPIDSLNATIAIKDERGMLMFSTNSMQLGDVYSLKQGEYVIRFTMLNRLPRGNYQVDAALIKGEDHYLGCYHWHENVSSFKVHDSIVSHFQGHIYMDADVLLKSATNESAHERKRYKRFGSQVRSLGRTNKPLSQFKAVISPITNIGNVFPDMDICVPVRIENISREPWAASGKKSVALTYRWLAKNGDVVVADGVRTRLPGDVLPGRAVIIPMQVTVPSERQSLQLVISLVQEAVAWFVDKNPASSHVATVEFD
jgi:hypothetical protein